MSVEPTLKRQLGFITMVAIVAGSVIGGWLVEAPYWFSVTGAGSAFIFLILAVLLIPAGLAFAELTAMLPFASAIDAWTTSAFGHKSGWAAQWLMFLVQVVEPPMMAFIFLTAVNYFIPIPVSGQVWVAIALIVIWYIFSNFNISITGALATVFFFMVIAIALIVSCMFFFSGNWSSTNLTAEGGLFPQGGYGIFIAMAVFSLKFIGFEMTPTLIEETTFPVKNMWKVILAGLLVPAILYFIVVMAIAGLAPWTDIAAMDMPEPALVQRYGLPAIIGIIAIIAGLLHAFTTLMGFWISSSRVLYGAAQMNQLPKVLGKLNKRGQPFVANIVVLAFSIFFCLFTGDNWVQYIYAVSCIAAGAVYFICCLDALVLRRKHPEWARPYKAPMGNILFPLGMIISLWIAVGSCLELPVGGYISLAIFLLIGLVLFVIMNNYRKTKGLTLRTYTPADIEK